MHITKQDGSKIYIGDHLTNASGSYEVVVSAINGTDRTITLRWINFKTSHIMELDDVFTLPIDSFTRSGWAKL